VDKTSDQDIIGIKNFTNGITATEITATKIKGDKTIDGKTTFVVSPKVPEPTDNNDAVNKAYVDDKTIINNFTNKPTPVDTDNLAIQETGGLLKKLSFANLKESLKNIFLTKPELVAISGSATFDGTTQNINLTDDQSRILAKIYEDANSTCSNILNSNDIYSRIVSLTGSAGTGKTFLTVQIIKKLCESNISCSVTAPTHKAASVIGEAIYNNGIKISAKTIHSFLGIKPFIDYATGIESFTVDKRAKKNCC
jgi:RecG-like helicase